MTEELIINPTGSANGTPVIMYSDELYRRFEAAMFGTGSPVISDTEQDPNFIDKQKKALKYNQSEKVGHWVFDKATKEYKTTLKFIPPVDAGSLDRCASELANKYKFLAEKERAIKDYFRERLEAACSITLRNTLEDYDITYMANLPLNKYDPPIKPAIINLINGKHSSYEAEIAAEQEKALAEIGAGNKISKPMIDSVAGNQGDVVVRIDSQVFEAIRNKIVVTSPDAPGALGGSGAGAGGGPNSVKSR